ncbi:MAG: aldo/keto reductase [Bacteroidales bacterium]|jgi:aryl-alcohol dehydrogenase-like predicted oxidoreductase
MEKRQCVNAGLELSLIGTGCWAFGGGKYWGAQDQKDVNDVVRASIDLGISYFDTAEVYNEGRSESSLGEAIRGIPRDSFLIGTKISPSNCYRETLTDHCEASLKRLQTDYIDIYMVHWPLHPHSIRHFTDDIHIIENPPDINDTLETLQELKQCGKIRNFGVSNFSRIRLENLPLEEIAVNELPYNLLCRAVEYDTLPFCEEKGIGVIGYMALLQGILADIYSSFDDIPVWQRRTRHFSSRSTKECRHGEEGAEKETAEALENIRRVCKESGYSMAEIAIKWILGNSAITCALVGSRNVNELEANVRSVRSPLSKEIRSELDRITFPVMQKLGNHFDYYESAENDRTI